MQVHMQNAESLTTEQISEFLKARGAIRAYLSKVTVETILDSLPRTYTPELYQQKCDLVYQHIFDSYQGQGKSLYAAN